MEIGEFKHGYHAEIPSLRISSTVCGLVYEEDNFDRSGSVNSRDRRHEWGWDQHQCLRDTV